MSKQIVLSPFQNVEDVNEQRVLALLSHISPLLENWRTGEDLRLELEDLNKERPGLISQIEQSKTDLANTKQKISKIFWDISNQWSLAPPAGALLIIINFFANFHVGVYGAGIVLIGIGASKLMQIKNGLNSRLMEIEKTYATQTSALLNIDNRIIELNKELNSRANTFPEVVQTTLNFPVSFKKILGNQMLLDESGIFANQTLRTIDLSEIQTNLSEMSAEIDRIKHVPVLLSPEHDQNNVNDPLNTLYGEEQLLQNLVNQFINTVGLVNEVNINLPLISKDNYLVQQIIKDGAKAENSTNSSIEISESIIKDSDISKFVDEVNKTKEFGTKILNELKETFDSLENISNTYSVARSNSINNVHENLFEVLNRASWCSKRFYCPRTIQAPKYLEDILDVHPNDAHKLPYDELIERLKSDPIIAKRIKDRPELDDVLYINYGAIHEFEDELEWDDNGDPIDTGSRPAFITDQFEESVQRFRRSLSVIMTGSPNPVLGFSTEAKMFFDPETDEWRSDTVPYVYNSATMIKYGQVLKVNNDLMIPLWEHLWTEKADFRKSELFRTNESLIRMSEKESEKLLEIGNQFRADMRTVRENVYHLEADLRSKYDEILNFRDGMSAIGLLSERQQAQLTDDQLSRIMHVDQSLVTESEENETLLGAEPKNQSERRGTAVDPIDIVRAPNVLVSYEEKTVSRLTNS